MSQIPIVTHEDEVALAKLDVELADIIKKIGKKIGQLSSQERSLGDSYQDYSKLLAEYARKMRDISKQMEVLAREERSGIEAAEVDAFKKKIAAVDDQTKKIETYYDRMKDLAVHKESLTKKMDEYAALMVENAKIRKKIVEFGLRIEKEKNKMIAADSLSKLEDDLKDTERDFERSKKELEKKWDQLVQERAEVNGMWIAYKNSIDKFE